MGGCFKKTTTTNKQTKKRNYGIYIFKNVYKNWVSFLDLKPRWRERRRFLLWQPVLVALTTTPTYLKAGGPAPGAPHGKRTEKHLIISSRDLLQYWLMASLLAVCVERDEMSPLYGPVLCDSILFSFLFISYIYNITSSLCLTCLVLCVYNGERYWISNGVSRFLFSSSTDVCLRLAATE